MPSDRYSVQVTGDARDYEKAIQRVEALQAQAGKRAQAISQQIASAENKLSKDRLASLERLYKEQVKVQERYAKQAVSLAQKSSRDQAKAQQDASTFLGRAGQGFARSVGPVPGFPVPFLGGGVAGIGGALAGAAVGFGIQKTVGDVIERAKAVRELQTVVGGATSRVSEFIAVGEQFGVTSDKMADAARNLASAIVNNPEQLEALGIATKDANGHSRELIDVFEDTRGVLSSAKGDYNTLRIAQELLGKSAGDLIPWLRASQEKIDAAANAARRAGLVMSNEAVEGALRYKAQLDSLGRSVNGVVQQIGQRLIPVLGAAAEAAMVAGDMIGLALERTNNPLKDIPLLGGLSNVVLNAADVAEGKVNADTSRIARGVVERAQVREDFNRLMTVGAFEGGGQTDLTGKNLEALQRAEQNVTDAIREQIDALRDRQQAQQETLRETLEGHDRERAVRIRAIEDEQRAYEDAYRSRDEARSDTIDALREELRGIQSVIDAEQLRKDLAEAELDLRREQAVTVTRENFRTALEYYQAVNDQEKRTADAMRKVADTKKKIEVDAKKSAIEERIRLIDKERDADRRALDEFKRGADTRLRAIRDEQQAEHDRVETAINDLKRETDTLIKELEGRLKAHQNYANGIRSTYSGLSSVVSIGVGGGSAPAAVNTGGGGQDLAQRKGEQQAGGQLDLHSARALKESLLGRNAAYEEYAGYVGRTRASVEREIMDSVEYRLRQASLPGGGGGGGSNLTAHDYPHSVTLNEPTLMVGMRSRQPLGVAAATGKEGVTFHGVGKGGGKDGLTVNLGGIHVNTGDLRDARRQTHEAVDTAFQDLEEQLANENSFGSRGA